MKKIFTIALAASAATCAFAQEVSFGISRPLVEGSTEYDNFAYIELKDFVAASAANTTMSVAFYQSAEIEATIVADEESDNGYEFKELRRQGVSVGQVDYVWKPICSDFSNDDVVIDEVTYKKVHNGVSNEGYAFGFDFVVPEGQSLALSTIEMDLLVENNPTYNIRIVKDDANVYEMGWLRDSGGYNNAQWGAGSYVKVTASEVSFDYGINGGENGVKYYGIKGTRNPLNGLVLESGSYRIVVDFDWANENAKGLSFDHLTIAGNLESAPTAINAVEKANADAPAFNLAGQRTNEKAAAKGLVVKDGKKMIVK